MTARLEQAVSRLTPAQLEKLTQLAESLARQNPASVSGKPESKKWKYDWVGGLSDQPEQSGIEAQAAAMAEWDQMIDRGHEK